MSTLFEEGIVSWIGEVVDAARLPIPAGDCFMPSSAIAAADADRTNAGGRADARCVLPTPSPPPAAFGSALQAVSRWLRRALEHGANGSEASPIKCGTNLLKCGASLPIC